MHDDETYFKFVKDTPVAQLLSWGDLHDPERRELRERMQERRRGLSVEERARMTQKEVEGEEEVVEFVRQHYEALMHEIETFDPDGNNFEIIDTDYENFLVLYACREFEENVNRAGQTES